MRYLKKFESILKPHLIDQRIEKIKRRIEKELSNKVLNEELRINNDFYLEVHSNVSEIRGNVYIEINKIPLWLNRVKVFGNFIITLKVESLEGCPKWISGEFDASWKELKSLEGGPQFVGGDYIVNVNNLTDLKGCPKEVGGTFDCSSNSLTSLEGSPKVGSNFLCNLNKLTDLKGSPEKIYGKFKCNDNYLESLEGSPKIIERDFDCSYNRLESLEFAPKKVEGDFIVDNNSVNFTEKYIRSVIEVGGRVWT